MVGLFLAVAVLSVLLISLSKKRGKIFFFSLVFFFVPQILLCPSLFLYFGGETFLDFFTVDTLNTAMFALISVVALLVVISSYFNLEHDNVKNQRLYYIAIEILDLMLLGVIFSNNIVMNWIFLEGTTLAVSVISYHHRNFSAVEATWKYIFISSVAIAITYMGILLLGSESSKIGLSLSYADLSSMIPQISPILLKVAFVLIFVGYSVKLEVIPLYTATVDVNHVAPSPAAAFISSALAGSAMVSLLRLYRVMSCDVAIFTWVKHLLLLVGALSVVFSAIYMGRTKNCKRLLSYSTVENNGIAMLGLAVGGIGVFAAILHTFAHMLVKAVLFIQIGTVGKVYGTLTLGKHSGYMAVDSVGAFVLILGTIAISAFPPSLLFISELTVFKEMLSGDLWWVLIIVMVMLLLSLYWMLVRILLIVFRGKSESLPSADSTKVTKYFSIFLLIFIIAFFIVGLVMPAPIVSYIKSIADSIIING